MVDYDFNPFTGNFDAILDLTGPIQYMGAIAVNSDFPTSAEVQNGWFYTITADVTDNDASKTNTGQSFNEGDEIIWNGTDWTIAGNELKYVPYNGATADVDIGTHAFKQTRATSDPNFLGLTYMKGLKATSATVDDDENADGGYFTFTPTDTIGTMRFETKGGAYSTNKVELRFDITDQKIHVDNAIVIDETQLPAGTRPAIAISDGTDAISLTGSTVTSTDGSVNTVITPTTIEGSPTITMDKQEQDTDVLVIKDSAVNLGNVTNLSGFDAYWTSLGGIDFTDYLDTNDQVTINSIVYNVDSFTSTTITTTPAPPAFDMNIYAATYDEVFYHLNSDGKFESPLLPNTNSLYDLGNDSLYWRNIFINEIKLNTTYSDSTFSEGDISWNADRNTARLTMFPNTGSGKVNLNLGYEETDWVINKTGSEILAGSFVFIDGVDATTELKTIVLADALSTTTPKKLAFVERTISNDSSGIVKYRTEIDAGTSPVNFGDTVYLSTTSGQITTTAPTAPNHIIKLGIINKDSYFAFDFDPSINYVDAVTHSQVTSGNPHNVTAEEAFAVNRNFVNGSFAESFDARVTSNGTTITMSLEQSGTGDLTMQFSDGDTVLDCTPACTIALTAGTNSAPQSNWVYIPQSTKVLTKSTTGWPTGEHIKIAYFYVPSAAYVQTDGPYINQNWNDHLMGTDNQGHMTHMAQKIRRLGATYFSGVDPAGATGYLTISGSTVYFKSSSGVISQMHDMIFPAKDTSGTDDAHVVNWSGDPFHAVHNLYDIVADSTGTTIGNNQYFNLVVWGVVNKTGEYTTLMINLPSGTYSNSTDAENDVNKYTNYNIPREFSLDSGTGFLIVKILARKLATSWTRVSAVDLRGKTPSNAAGGGTTISSTFKDSLFEIFDDGDATKRLKFEASGITTATTRTITMPDANVNLTYVGDQNVKTTSSPTFVQVKGVNRIFHCPIINPNGLYTHDPVFPIGYVDSNITVTRVIAQCKGSTSYEILGDVKYADNLTALTNPVVINDFDTTSGVRDDSTITSPTVASGKWMYLQFDSAPNSALKSCVIDIHWKYT